MCQSVDITLNNLGESLDSTVLIRQVQQDFHEFRAHGLITLSNTSPSLLTMPHLLF